MQDPHEPGRQISHPHDETPALDALQPPPFHVTASGDLHLRPLADFPTMRELLAAKAAIATEQRRRFEAGDAANESSEAGAESIMLQRCQANVATTLSRMIDPRAVLTNELRIIVLTMVAETAARAAAQGQSGLSHVDLAPVASYIHTCELMASPAAPRAQRKRQSPEKA